MKNIPKISVMIITYNQEKLIGRALDSLLCQKEFIYEICINDDCSKDNTWNVLQEYARNYPDLVKPVENEHNLGIFQNIEAVWKRPSGDMVYLMAGDDECGRDYFKAVIDCIKNKKIDYKNELFCIYGDYIQVFPDGKQVKYNNRAAEKNVPPIRLKLHGLIHDGMACYSIKILKKFKDVSDGFNYSVESVQDCQLSMFTDKNYYVPVVGSIYYAAIGVSVHANDKLEGRDKEMRKRLIDFMNKENIPLDKKDLAFMNFKRELRTFSKERSIKSFFNVLHYYINSIDYRLGWDSLYIKDIWRAIQRRKYYQ